MRGEEDRECRAKGGAVYAGKGSHPLKEFHGKHPHNAPDATLKRGAGPLFRKRGGKVPEAFKEHDAGEHAAAIGGKGKKPHFGRPGRKGGGRAGHSDLTPTTSAETPRPPKQRHIMSEAEKTP